MVGIDTSGKVTGVSILSISETAGLGMNARNESFINQYIGKSGTIGICKNGASDTEIQALTGATITSKAVTSAVNTALSLYFTDRRREGWLKRKRYFRSFPRDF